MRERTRFTVRLWILGRNLIWRSQNSWSNMLFYHTHTNIWSRAWDDSSCNFHDLEMIVHATSSNFYYLGPTWNSCSNVALTYECDRTETNGKFVCVARCSAWGWTEDINVSGAVNLSKQETSKSSSQSRTKKWETIIGQRDRNRFRNSDHNMWQKKQKGCQI